MNSDNSSTNQIIGFRTINENISNPESSKSLRDNDHGNIQMDEICINKLNTFTVQQNITHVLEDIEKTFNNYVSEPTTKLPDNIDNEIMTLDLRFKAKTLPELSITPATSLTDVCLLHDLMNSINKMLLNLNANMTQHLAEILDSSEVDIPSKVNSTESQGSVAVSDTAGFLVIEKQDVEDEKQNL